ncbi:hypothetical protein LTR37_010488 [Vermiconidia calcicola]|uniref:Uncharacterized protein n=1 Tax=Vermiconidia calcicola TaxID=1690605 RepID=A0ACC3N6A9_9PEZI|nr:hypothetical protein LTR37_010488 [Vermiconidia calcicola]
MPPPTSSATAAMHREPASRRTPPPPSAAVTPSSRLSGSHKRRHQTDQTAMGVQDVVAPLRKKLRLPIDIANHKASRSSEPRAPLVEKPLLLTKDHMPQPMPKPFSQHLHEANDAANEPPHRQEQARPGVTMIDERLMSLEPRVLAEYENLSDTDDRDTAHHLVVATIRAQRRHIDDLQQRCNAHQQQIKQLVRRHDDERDASKKDIKKEVMRKTQAMMLDMIRLKEAAKARENTLQREKHYISEAVKKEREEKEKYIDRLSVSELQRARERREMLTFQEESEHKQALINTLQEDMDALRQIENESTAHRRRQTQGLPPAYGNLDDEDHKPPYQVHKDKCSFDIPFFFRSISAGFENILCKAQNASKAQRSHYDLSERSRASSQLFYTTVKALSVTCAKLREVICYADGEVASTIIRLSWSVVCACELRPGLVTLTSQERATIGLAYQEIDSCLLEALRSSLTPQDTAEHGRGPRNPAFEYQLYLTPAQVLADKFWSLASEVGQGYLVKTIEWLSENVEVERKLAAEDV